MLINACFTYVGTYAPRVQGCTCVRTCVVVVVVVVRDHFNFYVVSRRRTAPRKTCHPDSGRGQVDVAPDLMHEPAKRQSFFFSLHVHCTCKGPLCTACPRYLLRVAFVCWLSGKKTLTHVRTHVQPTHSSGRGARALASGPSLHRALPRSNSRSSADRREKSRGGRCCSAAV